MAISWPFDSTVTQDTEGNPVYSRAYSADILAKFLAKYFRNGIFNDTSDELMVVANEGMTVLVNPGYANINGRQFCEESARVLTVQAASADLDRMDTVVLRLNLVISALTIDLYIVEGTPASVPSAPNLTRNASVWELGLANLFVAKNTTTVTQQRITDTRLDNDRCGVVASIIGETDTSAYYAQIAADLAAFRSGAEANFAQFSATQQAAFTAWFAAVRETLGGDVAGNLLNLINAHAPISLAVSLPASGWAGSGPYTQTVAATGMLATDTPFADVTLSDAAETARAQLEAYALVGRIDAGAGSVTVTCYDNAPAVDLTVSLKVVR